MNGGSGKTMFLEHADEVPREEVERRAYIRGAIDTWRARLGLRDWEIRYDPTANPAPGSFAIVDTRHMERVAQVQIDPSVPSKAIDVTLAHELGHIVMRDLSDLISRLLLFVPEGQARTMMAEMAEDLEERVIEQFAVALAGGPRFVATGALAERFPAFAA